MAPKEEGKGHFVRFFRGELCANFESTPRAFAIALFDCVWERKCVSNGVRWIVHEEYTTPTHDYHEAARSVRIAVRGCRSLSISLKFRVEQWRNGRFGLGRRNRISDPSVSRNICILVLHFSQSPPLRHFV